MPTNPTLLYRVELLVPVGRRYGPTLATARTIAGDAWHAWWGDYAARVSRAGGGALGADTTPGPLIFGFGSADHAEAFHRRILEAGWADLAPALRMPPA